MSTLATLKILLKADASGVEAGLAKAEAASKGFADSATSNFSAAKLGVAGLAIGVVALGAMSVKMAGDFQQSAIQLVTGAGEAQANLGLVTNGILQMSSQVGTSSQDLIRAMYTVESAGHHGADGLLVLNAAAEAAKAGNADLGTVTDALTSIMASYHESGKEGISIANQLIATEQSGKLRMDDLAGSLSAVVPLASQLNISFAQVGGAIATMTNHGESAQEAAQNLANAIRSLANPNSVATKAMAQMGLNSMEVAKDLGTKGLTGTIDELQQAVLKHMGPAGLVLQNSFNQSKAAASDALEMLNHLPPSLQALGKEYLNNEITSKEWRKALMGQDVQTAALGRQFATTVIRAHGFNDALRSGSPAAKTYAAEMSNMMGGATGLNVALMLGGENMPNFVNNVNHIADAAKNSGKNVKDWSLVQSGFNFQLSAAMDAAGAAGIKIGTQLLPAVTSLLQTVTPLVPVVADLALSFGSHIVPAVQTAAPIIGVVAGAWALWNAGLMITKGIGIVSMILEFVSGMSLAGIASNAMAVAQWALNVAMDANPIGLIIIAIAALAAGFIWAYNNIKPFHQAVDGAWAFLKTVPAKVEAFAKAIPGFFNSLKNGVVGKVTELRNDVVNTVTRFVNDIKGFVLGLVQTVVGDFLWLYNHNYYFRDLVLGIILEFTLLRDGAMALWNFITGFLTGAWTKISTAASAIWGFISGIFIRVFNADRALILGTWSIISGALSAAWNGISKTASGIWDGISKTIGGAAKSIGDTLGGLASQALQWGENLINEFIQGIKNKVADLKNQLGDTAKQVANFLGFHSPTKEGPGSDADKWAPNLVKMMASGLTSHRSTLGTAASGLAGTLAASFNGSSFTAQGGGTAVSVAGGSDVQQAILQTLQALLAHVEHGADITGIEAKLVSLMDKAQRGSRKGARLGLGVA